MIELSRDHAIPSRTKHDPLTKPDRAAILVRISDDRAGDAAGVARQEQDARALATRYGWTVTEVIAENDTSAYKRRKVTLPDGTRDRRVVRPEFRRLLALLRLGEADGLIAYDLDRVARDPCDLEDLIDVVEQMRIPVESVTGSLRLSSDADVTMARVMVAVANKASRDMSRRISRKMRAIAEEGRPSGGPRRFGFEIDGITHRRDEVVAIRWAARRLTAGAEMRDVLRGLEARVSPVKGGNTWHDSTVHEILRNPRVAGLRVYKGEILGPAVWKPILDQDTWARLLAALDARPGAGRTQVIKNWLSGVLMCGRCGTRLASSPVNYTCLVQKGCGRICVRKAPVEAEIERRVLDKLTGAQLPAVTSVVLVSAEETERGLAADQAQLRSVARLWAQRHVTLAEYAEARTVIERRIVDARAVLAAARADRARAILGSGDVAMAWRTLDPRGKRDVTLAVLGRVLVKPSDPTRGRGRFQPDRLEMLGEEL